MSFKFEGLWSYNSFYSHTDFDGAASTLTPWLQNGSLQVRTDEQGNVSGYLNTGFLVLTVLGTVEQPTTDGQHPKIKLNCNGLGTTYLLNGEVIVDKQAITGTATCVQGDIDKQPDGTSGIFFLASAEHNQKLVIDESGPVKLAYATHFDDVEEILARDDVFFVTYEKKMRAVTDGYNFFLGMQDSPEYQQDVANMRSVVRREDLAAIKDFVSKHADSIVDNAGGKIDLVSTLARTVPAQWFMDYFGCKNDDVAVFVKWACDLFRFVFAPGNSDEFNQQALVSAKLTREFLDKVIAARKSSSGDYDDILSRCLALQNSNVPRMTDTDIRNNFIGLLTGAVLTTSSAVANVIDQLLSRPKELAAAQKAARENDDELLARYVFEALRFNPVNAGLTRFCSQDYIVAKDTERATLIKQGTIVVTGTLSAMFDPQQIDQPELFKIDRPEYRYLYFGSGLHKCFGQHINNIQIPAIAKALLKRADLRHAPGDEGQIQLQGGFPSSFTVLFNKDATATDSATSSTEENNMSEPSFFNPSQNALNLVLPVKQPIKENAAGLRAVLTQLTPGGLNNVGTVHFGRFLFLDNDTKFLVFTEYDGTFGQYINDFINETGDAFNAMLSFLDIPEGVLPVQTNRKAFHDLIEANDVKEEVLYSAYPKLSVIEIQDNN